LRTINQTLREDQYKISEMIKNNLFL